MLVYFAVTLIAMIGFCGLAVDTARLELRQLQLQAAADAGALGGAMELANGGTDWSTVGTDDALANETANGVSGASNSAQQGASTGPYMNNDAAVQVTARQTVPTLFMSVLGIRNVTLSASGVALGSAGACLYAGGSPALTSSVPSGEGLEFYATNVTTSCNIYSVPGVEISQASISGSGAVQSAAPASQSSVTSSSMSHALQSGVSSPGDPLAYLTEPTPGACITQSIFGAGANGPNKSYNPVLSPGTYCNGLSASSANVTFSPGLYIIEGGASFTNGTFAGTGVTFYFTKNSSGSYGTVNWSSAGFAVSAPTTSANGGYPGVLIFADRAWSGGNQDFVFQNGSSLGQDGIIYVPHAGFKNQQCSLSGNRYFGIIAGNYSLVNGSMTLSNDYSSLPGGAPTHGSATMVQ